MATEPKNTLPTPSPWISVIIGIVAAVVGYFAAVYNSGKEAGKLEYRLQTVEGYIDNDKKTKDAERLAREARYQEAEAKRNQDKDAEVAELQKTNQELQAALLNLKK